MNNIQKLNDKKMKLEKQRHTFPPIFNQNSTVLILGTFPSVKSREASFFYHHPQNRFWKIIASLTESKVPQTIEEKQNMLLSNNIAVWDVVESCRIKGSSDSSICDVMPSDLNIVLDHAPIKKIYANGQKAYQLYMKYSYEKTGRPIEKLPSSSPANASWSLDRLLEAWKVIRIYDTSS